MKGCDFVITGLQSWDIPIGSNAIDIAKEISKDNRVLYVNSPLDLMTMLRNKPAPETVLRKEALKRKRKPVRRIHHNLWVLDFPFFIWSVNDLPDGFLFDSVNKLNNRNIFSYVQKTAHQLGFDNIIHFIDNDIYRSFYSKEYLSAVKTIYYRRDNLHPFHYWKKHVSRLEPKLIQKSDLILCNSPQLADYAQKYNTNSFNIGQGVDLSSYDPEKQFDEPAFFRNIKTPRIGYIGDINSMRLDADLIYELALSKPNYSFILTGKEDALFQNHKLHQLRNVHFTGSIPKNEVPQYMAALDVCINPQQINDITIGNYPRKVDEYLAMGKPVVATATKTMELFKKHVYLCSSLQDYQIAVEKAITENNSEKMKARIEFARSHSWKNNVQAIYKHISENIN
jgi:glycosyltransferase involved in cell wall biosynthesis